eukprot:TRINITY_DN25962_c0_g1_i1.p1 TRINITY_DN25962_c0_g1~~TRINITY_DN25962_c0_g1_i1.p1  ORF type:complete len:207 (+),score=19.21 TRINITY_DN25962_c0_g1_i1:62-682(+)
MATSMTLCVQNLPCKVLEEDFRKIMTDFGLDVSRYTLDFPKRIGRQQRPNNFGYGFVACRQEEDAAAFERLFQGFHFENIQSAKRLHVEAGVSGRFDNQAARVAQSWNRVGDNALSNFSDARGSYVGNARSSQHALSGSGTAIDDYEGRVSSPAEYEVPATRLADFEHGVWSRGDVLAKHQQVSSEYSCSYDTLHGKEQEQMTIWQ